MSTTSRAAEDLEAQYREYKGQFEQWKEKNKNSIGTDAYNAYVDQFKDWERDVEKRRKNIKEKAEREALDMKTRIEEEEKQKKLLEKQEAEAAAEVYAASQAQQQYMDHHKAALEFEQKRQQQHQQLLQQHQMQQQIHPQMMQYNQPPPAHQTMHSQPHMAHHADPSLNPEAVMQQMMSVVMGGAAAAMGGAATVSHLQQPPPSAQAALTSPSAHAQLWGSTKAPYDPSDPMFSRWGMRAAPGHVPPMHPRIQASIPCWLTMAELNTHKMVLAPKVMFNHPPPPVFHPPLQSL